MAGPMSSFDYISDNGTTYRMRLDTSNATSMGGVARTSTLFYPIGWQPRYILCENATYGRRKVVAPDPADAHWVGGTNTIALQVVGVAVSPTFDITARIGEKRTSRGG